jgi:hypothetical protein
MIKQSDTTRRDVAGPGGTYPRFLNCHYLMESTGQLQLRQLYFRGNSIRYPLIRGQGEPQSKHRCGGNKKRFCSRFYFTHTQGTDKCTLPEYVSTYIINHLHVSVASVTIIRVLYRNTDKILTNCPFANVKPLDVTVIISGSLCGFTMLDC